MGLPGNLSRVAACRDSLAFS